MKKTIVIAALLAAAACTLPNASYPEGEQARAGAARVVMQAGGMRVLAWTDRETGCQLLTTVTNNPRASTIPRPGTPCPAPKVTGK